MKVHINELKTGSKKGYKVRWTAEGKPKEKFRKNRNDNLASKMKIEYGQIILMTKDISSVLRYSILPNIIGLIR